MNTPTERMKRKTMTPRVLKYLFNILILSLIGYWSQTKAAQAAFDKLFSISWTYLIALMSVSLILMLISSIRWAKLISAFGNPVPPTAQLLKLSLIGHFYNTFVPGAIGGDVLRATVTRVYYKKENTSFLVVLSERLLGLICLCILLLLGIVSASTDVLPAAIYLGSTGLVAIIFITALVYFRARLQAFTQPYLDGLERPRDLLWAFLTSLVGQLSTLSLFALILTAFNAQLTLSSMLFIFPLGLLASVIPLTVLGAGAREVALISLLVSYGNIEQSVAVSISTAYLGCLWFLGLLGGALHMLSRIQR